MRVDKVILRTVLSTLAAIGTLLVFMVVALCAVFPSTMMELTYKLGMESSSIHFAERAYKDSEEIFYIAYATEVSIEQDKKGKIVSCGERFIQDEDFALFCEAKGDSYEQFIYGQISVSKYEQGDKQGAIDFAYASLAGKFAKNNAVVALLVAAMENKDATTAATIKEKLTTLNVDGEDKTYLSSILALLGD